ncbi:hypothetical protein C731_4485 [Mycolicibacterium hassiacum DSM 44199]|jgi:hypothetical protein|uniref:Uncharacterized protein n=1 Tax=Mycolicibacterium hassiacum (strain DSM 44199 / CIP 105218 / JCM 12690 / 3849) TaxID=1122247 RepID=K5BA35_MYCHD|nr:hypothetical protein [Mycolicibacterium hassiacum]EKF21550.1 hypothetical protein C731_4485 [Mycolicibacterium hassiacum DSM 44199]MBX5485869.1 hypothetical protein [Mycolicibacterium hassiacum]MDA4088536.1 hypothetical protein [Mycolicibacterium hassiacum DSM 44199]PZN18403.1 MAG: hypothetical protein DIU75_17120 [Mycolicibacterium hassiacum]VCT90077.1 hypothetical protein MHAS_01781 [Mycolicibacterium hassiacum DSM 44199]
MKKLGFAGAVASGLAAAAIALAAPVTAAPTAGDNALDTIQRLKSEGYTVIVNRIGNAPLDQAKVIAVRPGTTHTWYNGGQVVPSANHHYHYLTEQTNTIYVDVK